VLGGAAVAAEPAAALPWEAPALGVETGVLWQMGRSTPFGYRIYSTQFSWRSGEFMGHVFADGSRLVVRHRLTLIGDVVQNGPESHYVGFSGSPSVEWWDKTGTHCWFTGAGGGFGWIDSSGVKGGQTQDLTLNWFIRAGVEHVTAKRNWWSAGLFFQHLSNGGMTKPHPGINGVGFSLGYAWGN